MMHHPKDYVTCFAKCTYLFQRQNKSVHRHKQKQREKTLLSGYDKFALNFHLQTESRFKRICEFTLATFFDLSRNRVSFECIQTNREKLYNNVEWVIGQLKRVLLILLNFLCHQIRWQYDDKFNEWLKRYCSMTELLRHVYKFIAEFFDARITRSLHVNLHVVLNASNDTSLCAVCIVQMTRLIYLLFPVYSFYMR